MSKRKSDAGAATSSKKARTSDAANPHASAVALVSSILADRESFVLPDDDDAIIDNFIQLAQYARALEGQIASGSGAGGDGPQKSPEAIQAAAEKLRRAAVAGIKKQMSWKPSCKTGGAKFLYDGVCADPAVFGAMFGLNEAPTWKQKKIPTEEFEKYFGDIVGSVRYDSLYITSKDVNVKYADGEFKISGTYGVSRSL
ncbi:hypothetical protein BXZ70DRAFT_344568 [Cristinia sonorae]|uniref:Uncharacterized protein n=1 Tax=Cristinia sonorae TaxID=1940300 RepID=A0A8K0UJY9_9AGAR|nr:hypothetical protein BXZ70DRAFT_344568 [Cristinia sonorae]